VHHLREQVRRERVDRRCSAVDNSLLIVVVQRSLAYTRLRP
jgi:hypothetical protein